MKKSLTIKELKERIGKPVFVMGLIYGSKGWRVLSENGFAKTNTLEFTDRSKILECYLDKFRFFDEEVTSLELKEILDAEEKAKKKTGYERVGKGEKYCTVSRGFEIRSYNDTNGFDEKKYNVANYFNDENLMKNIARAEQLKYQLRRYAALNGGIPSQEDWNDYEIFKYFIACNYRKNEIYATYISTQRDSFQIYFKDIKACKKAIEIFKNELLWYFTKFEEQLY